MAEADTEQQLKALANILLLQQRLREAQNAAELGFILVNDTQSLLPYRSALLWLTNPAAEKKGRISNISGAVEHDDHSPFVQWMRSLCRKLAVESGTRLAQYQKADLPPELSAQWDAHGDQYLIWCPLRSASGVNLGAFLMWREQALSESEGRVLGNWLNAASYSLAALKGKPFARPGFVWTARRKHIALAVAVMVFLLMFMPVRLSVLAQAEIVAREPLVVRSPMDGIISSLHVRPNAVVVEGALLLKLDDTELQTRQDVAEQTLAISRAQYRQAGQAAAFDANAKASLRVLALESEKRQSEVEYVSSLLERSDIEADRGGVVIMPNPDELIGKPVVTGERLMTIADPLDTQLEAWLSVGDDITLLFDAHIEFFPNVAPDKKYSGRLRRMDYRAEPAASGELAYRIRGDFEEGQILPRIGMRGTAKLYGAPVTLGYYLLRRPLATVRRWLGV
jgi:hypothetical protein